MESGSEHEMSCTPPEITEAAKITSLDLLPAKSQKVYVATYITSVKYHYSLSWTKSIFIWFNKSLCKNGIMYFVLGRLAMVLPRPKLVSIDTIKGVGSSNEVKWSYSLPYIFKDNNNKRYTMHMPPPPSSAIMIGMILNIVQRKEEDTSEQTIYSQSQISQFYHKVVEAMKHTFARRTFFGDSSSTPMSELYKFLSPHWGLTIRNLISPTNTFHPKHYVDASHSMVEDFGTTNVAAVASNGDAIVASSTLNDPFGSGIVSSSLGFLLNNNMLTFTMTENGQPLMEDFGNLVIANKRPLTSLCPIIVLDDEENFRLLIAASGSVRIPTTIALVLMRYFWIGDDIAKAISMFRFHHQLFPNKVLYEGRDKEYDMEYLRAYGHNVEMTTNKWPHVNVIVQENGTKYNIKDTRDNI